MVLIILYLCFQNRLNMILHLKELMKAKGVSSIALAEQINVSKATVSYWLNGKVFPTPDAIERIAGALGVPVWQLFASPEEVASGDAQSDFVAFVRSGGKNFTFTDKEELRDFANGLCGETKRPGHANIRGKEYFQLK